MLLLEIGYSEKYDTFTGYVYDKSEYFNYEVDRENIKLIQIEGNFTKHQHFIDTFSKKNSDLRFLSDPIEIKTLNHDTLQRYKKLTLHKSSNTLGMMSKLLFLFALACLMAGGYAAYIKYYHLKSDTSIFLPFRTAPEKSIIQYYYEVKLITGGLIVGFDIKQNKEDILVTSRKGLEVTIDLSSVRFIEKIKLNNTSSRQIIYGNNL